MARKAPLELLLRIRRIETLSFCFLSSFFVLFSFLKCFTTSDWNINASAIVYITLEMLSRDSEKQFCKAVAISTRGWNIDRAQK